MIRKYPWIWVVVQQQRARRVGTHCSKFSRLIDGQLQLIAGLPRGTSLMLQM